MEYVIATTVSTDEVHLADGTVMENQPGSAGFYALAGVRVFTDKVGICGGIGPEYLPRHEKWYRDNNVSTDGLIVRGAVAPTIVIHYYPDGDVYKRQERGRGGWRCRTPWLPAVHPPQSGR